MDATQLVVIAGVVFGLIGIATLGVVAIVLSRLLAYTNKQSASLGERAFDAAMAFHEEQREMRRIRFEADHQEFLLREARDRARAAAYEPRPPADPNEPDLVSTPPSTLA